MLSIIGRRNAVAVQLSLLERGRESDLAGRKDAESAKWWWSDRIPNGIEFPESDESNPPPSQVFVEKSSRHSPGSTGLEDETLAWEEQYCCRCCSNIICSMLVPLVILRCNSSPIELLLLPPIMRPDDAREASTDEDNPPPEVEEVDGYERGRSNASNSRMLRRLSDGPPFPCCVC